VIRRRLILASLASLALGAALPGAAAAQVPDEDPPQTRIESGPSDPTYDTTPSFEFSSTEPNSSFQCRLDSDQEADWRPCSSPYLTPTLELGEHSFHVRAIDEALNFDPTPAATSFRIIQRPIYPRGRCKNTTLGTGGRDLLDGNDGGDRIFGFGKRDVLRGFDGLDCLHGGRGNDRIVGGASEDTMSGGRGRDTLLARDGERDEVRCGGAFDVAVVDPVDLVHGTCETVKRAPAAS
jgi:hypothetical protein